jgi:cell division protein FtsQ
VSGTTEAASAERPRWWRLLRLLLVMVAAALTVASPWWGPKALSTLAFFHVRRVVFEGMRYTPRAEAIALLKVDTLQSVWQEMAPLAARLEAHPLVAAVQVTEREPVALVRRADGRLDPVDGNGYRLPIDPARVPMDVPLSASADSALLQLLDGLRTAEPALYARVERADRVKDKGAPDEFRLKLGPVTVRTTPEVTVSRFKDILPVEADLARNRLRVVELDLRFRNQVIARQP